MLALPYPDETFDYVIIDQVLEHLMGPCPSRTRKPP